VKFIDLKNPKAKPSDKFNSSSAKAPEKPFLQHIDDLYFRDQGMGKKALLSKTEAKKLAFAVGTKELVHNADDSGFFGTIFKAWGNHWNLRTSPEDWWLTVITYVARKVDDSADSTELRQLFRNGKEGKELISVDVDSFSIYDTDYSYVFSKFQTEIKNRIEIPGYADSVGCDFSTTSSTQLISSQITLMKSMQKYFDYEMRMCGCGLPALEMKGTQEDWARLSLKLKQLQSHLAPVEKVLKLNSYFELVLGVFDKLLQTFNDGDSTREWWEGILRAEKEQKYISGGSMPGKYVEVDAYSGWLIDLVTGKAGSKFFASDLASKKYAADINGLSSVPMKIVDVINNVSDMSLLIAGVMGFKIHNDSPNHLSTLEPAHGWTMLLPPDSPLRKNKKSRS